MMEQEWSLPSTLNNTLDKIHGTLVHGQWTTGSLEWCSPRQGRLMWALSSLQLAACNFPLHEGGPQAAWSIPWVEKMVEIGRTEATAVVRICTVENWRAKKVQKKNFREVQCSPQVFSWISTHTCATYHIIFLSIQTIYIIWLRSLI